MYISKGRERDGESKENTFLTARYEHSRTLSPFINSICSATCVHMYMHLFTKGKTGMQPHSNQSGPGTGLICVLELMQRMWKGKQLTATFSQLETTTTIYFGLLIDGSTTKMRTQIQWGWVLLVINSTSPHIHSFHVYNRTNQYMNHTDRYSLCLQPPLTIQGKLRFPFTNPANRTIQEWSKFEDGIHSKNYGACTCMHR